MPEHVRRVADPETLKALTHPLRRRIMRELDRAGTVNSSTLATRLGQNTGTLSYHLRQLERYGYIEDVPERGNHRERWWRRTNTSWETPDPTGMDPADRAVIEQVTRRKLASDARDIAGIVDNLAANWDRDHPWTTWSRGGTHLTPEEFAEFHAEYQKLLFRYGHRIDEAPPGARAMRIRFYLYPEPGEDDD
ncbi:ArsR/SmtB family transcription factor [Actinocatenispora rupis]|uniref:Transcriptional regulator n=1 Tax=Actinocatenispora rupis TaxID=519421 RepID=A0A8J3J8K0_9ACTN|nr:helix-turn-helix domain-containing protein [Actinocatenispora rupis]GID13930.1 transcriptional regulator [Actinocatenispora rupis]